VRARTTDDIVRQATPYFLDRIEYDPGAVAKYWKDPVEAADILAATRAALATAPVWEAEPLEALLRGLAEARGTSAGKIFQPLRVALTGLTVSPGIFEMLLAMGRDLAVRRIDHALEAVGRLGP